MSIEVENTGQWIILELMGRKVLAGYATEEVKYGKALIRIDVPETSRYPSFSQFYGADAIYCITPVSEQVAKITAEANQVNPVSVYVPDLITKEQVERIMEEHRKQLDQLKLPVGREQSVGDDDVDTEDG